MKAKFKALSIDSRRNIFYTLVLFAALSLGVYIYAVIATVNHTVERKNLMSENSDLEARVSELEFKDIALKNKVNLETALARGMTEVKSPLYVERPRVSLTLR